MKIRSTPSHYLLRMSLEEWDHLVTVLNWNSVTAWLEERNYLGAANICRSLNALSSDAMFNTMARQPAGPLGPVLVRFGSGQFGEFLKRIDWAQIAEFHRKRGSTSWAAICEAFDRLRPLSHTGEQILAFLRGGARRGPQVDDVPSSKRRTKSLHAALGFH